MWWRKIDVLKLKRTRRTFYLEVKDSQAIEEIKAKYGCSTDSDCVRLAVRLVAESPVQVGKVKKGK
jgi:hypothetical protein